MDMMSLRRRVMVNQNKLVSATGNPITFHTPLDKPLKECVVRFTPQQEGSGTPSQDNVRNISGRSSVKLWQSGKNLAANGIYCGRLRVGNDVYVGSVYYCYYFPIPKAPIYIAKKGTAIPLISVSMEPPAANVPVITSGIPTMTNVKHYVFDNTEIGAKYMCLHGANNSKFQDLATLLDEAELMVTTGDYDDDYVTSPNRLNEITFSWESEGQIFGGFADLEKGEVVAEKDGLVFDGSEAWYLYSSNEYACVFALKPGRKPLDKNEACSHFKINGQAFAPSANHVNSAIWGSNSGTVFMQVSPSFASDITAFKQFLADEAQKGTPVTIVANALNPIHYSLTPQSIATLRGNNVIWSDANGDITVRYWTR